MNVVQNALTVFRFEWRRSLTVPRILWWIVLSTFPPGLLALVRISVGPQMVDDPEPIAIVVYVLCVGIACMLGVFLWAAPAIMTELEGRSWVYLAVRPHGAVGVLLGKYLAAVAWALPVGVASATLSILILAPDGMLTMLWAMWRLVILSCIAYAAVFALIGVAFPKRAMVFGIFYAIVFEAVLSSIPAVVNLLTVQYRLRCLFVRWMGWSSEIVGDNPAFLAYFGDESATWHVLMLLAMTGFLLLAAALILRWREFTSSAETDV